MHDRSVRLHGYERTTGACLLLVISTVGLASIGAPGNKLEANGGEPANPRNMGDTQVVQWTVEEGGNGHWYRHDVVPYPVGTELCGIGWAIDHGATQGGYPVTITSAEENDFVLEVLPYFNGVYSTAKIGCERSSGTWQWVTGEPFEYENFIANANNMTADLYDEESPYGPGWRGATWCYFVEVVGGEEGMSTIVEWSADCNDDGIVDYGQILDGSLTDDDGNGVPDCCDQGEPCSDYEGTDPVHWRIEDGGNGHWYMYIPGTCVDDPWVEGGAAEMVASAEAIGGHLATFADASEWDFVRLSHSELLIGDSCVDDWFFGLASSPGASDDWHWVTGEPVTFLAWGSDQCGAGPYPNNEPESTLAYASNRFFDCGQVWDDGVVGAYARNLMVEWSADCNGDGIVDYGQILDGSLVDTDSDGVPDICECSADLDSDLVVSIHDLLIVIAEYGTDSPLGDTNFDGLVDVNDILVVIASWGACP